MTHGLPTRDTHILIDNHGRPTSGPPPSRLLAGGARSSDAPAAQSKSSQLAPAERDINKTKTREDKQAYKHRDTMANSASDKYVADHTSDQSSRLSTARSGRFETTFLLLCMGRTLSCAASPLCFNLY